MGKTGRFRVFFDGQCPLCMREISWLRRRDHQRQIEFIDIAAPEFDEKRWQKTQHQLMAEIHGQTADGQWVKGVEVFRHLYTAVGFGRLVQCTRLPLVRQALDLGYRLFARNRLRLTGRCNLDGCESRSVTGAKE